MTTCVQTVPVRWASLALICAAASSGCSMIALGPKRLVGSVMIDERTVPGQQMTAAGEVQTRGDHVSIFAVGQCEVRDELDRTIEHTYHADREIVGDARAPLLLGAVASFALGSFLYLDADALAVEIAPHVSTDSYARTVPATAARATGGFFVGLGALSVAIVLIDTIRVSGSETSTDATLERSFVSKPYAYCGEAPFPDATVTATTATHAVRLGVTDTRGTLVLDAAKLRESLGGKPAQLSIEGVPIGAWPL